MKAVIQAGGLGTRFSSISKNLFPKSMALIENKPLLEHLISNLAEYGITEIFIIVGYLGEKIIDYFGDGKKMGVKITYFKEDADNLLGTGGALFYLKKKINDDFLFLLGDIFFNINFKRFIQYHYSKKSEVTLFVHPNSHPNDSDLIVMNEENKILKFSFKNKRDESYYANLVNAGLMIFSKSVFRYFKKSRKISYEELIIIPSIRNGKCYAYKSSEYVKDIGTPQRYENVCKNVSNKLHLIKNLSNKQRCVFLDRDGTIVKYIKFLRNIKDIKLINGVTNAIKLLNDSRYLVIVITNQPVVARGDITFSKLKLIHNKLETLLGDEGCFLDDLYFCPHHPDKGFKGEIKKLKIDCDCRKPKTGLITKAAKAYNIDLNKSFFIGDSTVDIMCAFNAKIRSILLKTGEAGLDKKYDIKPDYVYNTLLDAVTCILKRRK